MKKKEETISIEVIATHNDKVVNVCDLLKHLINENLDYFYGLKELKKWITENKHNENNDGNHPLVVDYGLLIAEINKVFPGGDE